MVCCSNHSFRMYYFRMKNKTLIELIEIIITVRKEFEDSGNESSSRRIKAAAEILAHRLELTTTAAIAFSFVFFEASWGRMPSREGVMDFLPPETSMVNRFECLWRLLDVGLVKSYKQIRSPVRIFYLEKNTAMKICSNISPLETPSLFKVNEKATGRITALASDGSDDYLLLIGEVQYGYILRKSDATGYEAFWLGELVLESENIDSVMESLNEMLDSGQLKYEQN